MEFGLGVQRRSSADFWAMTLIEYDLALSGHNRFHNPEPEVDIEGTRAFIEEMKRLHPDDPTT